MGCVNATKIGKTVVFVFTSCSCRVMTDYQNRAVVVDRLFDNLSGSHLQFQQSLQDHLRNLKMTSTQVVKTSVTIRTTNTTGLKPFTVFLY